jgi:protein phosphatase
MDSEPVLVRRAIAAVAGGSTDVGLREHNEDHVLLRPELGLFLLGDGAGGHNAGNVASALATTTVANVFETTAASLAERPDLDDFGLWTMARRLAAAIQRANAEVIECAKKMEKYQGMGTTIVALALSADGDMAHVAHVGDSRCYRVRSGLLEGLTVDHSLLVDVIETHPDVDDQLLSRMPRHVVTRALGMEDSVRVSVRTVRVLPGDLYLLCTDGLSDTLDEQRIEEILTERRTPEDHVRELTAAALAAGGEDNIGVIVVECVETEVAPIRRPSVRPIAVPPPEARMPTYSAPEIVIVGVESHVVPVASADASLLDALGRFARLRQPSAPELGNPKPARCRECGQPLEKTAAVCPTCGAAM